MDIRLAVVVFAVLLCQVHGQPRAAEEIGVSSSEDAKITPLQDFRTAEIKKIFPLQDFKAAEVKKIFPIQDFKTAEVKKIFPLQDFAMEVKKPTEGKKEESPGKLQVPLTSLGTKLKSRLLDDSKLPTTSKEVQEEAVRSARQSPSPPFHQMSFGKGPHMTTVCIQIRSDHQPQVICGPQIGEREDQPAAPAAARFASPYDYGRAGPQGLPAPGRGFPMRRSEQDLQPRPVDPNYQPASGPSPQNSLSPSRLNPSGPLNPVYVHRPYYEPVYSAGLMTPAQALMRLNCAVEPAGQLLNPQLVRGGALGYQEQPLGEAIFTLPDGSPAKFGANIVSPNPIRTQNGFAAPQGQQQWGRSASEEDMAYLNPQMPRSPQNYPSSWNYGAYPEDSSYLLDMMQGRSASSEDGYLGYPNEASSPDVYARKEYLQLQALRQSQEKLRDIQEQLTSLKEQQDLQNTSARNSSASEASKDSSSPTGLSIDIKATPTKASKRHTRT